MGTSDPKGRRLKDILAFKPSSDVVAYLARWAEAALRVSDWIQTNASPTDRSIVLSNLAIAIHDYLGIASREFTGPIQVVALCTRGCYELNLRTRDVLQSEENLMAWLAEAATDQISLLEGLRTFLPEESGDSVANRLEFDEEIQRIRCLLSKYKLPDGVRPPTTKSLAVRHGLVKEYGALFRLFSQLVHPSSYLVMGREQVNKDATRNVLVIQLQLYAGDSLERIRQTMNMPSTILRVSS